jgi:hypothetical protein
VYAAEGTVAHQLAEDYFKKSQVPEDMIGHTFSQDGFEIEITQEMVEAVRVYTDYIDDLKVGKEMWVEQQFHMVKVHEDLWGTSDCVLYDPKEKTLYVRDYKHGQGVPVEVVGNDQLKYYALGSLLEMDLPVSIVNVGICQPRCPHPDGPNRSIDFGAADLIDWSADLQDAVKATEKKDAALNPGEEQCRFCPAAASCPALQDMAMETAKDEFSMVVGSYDPEVLADNLEKLPMIEAWCKKVREFAYGEAEHGRKVPRHKLVQKQSRRYWKDDMETVKFLLNYKMEDADIYDRKLRSPAQIEKIIGKEAKGDIVDLIEKRSSGLVLVPESDKREEVKCNPADDFTKLK